MVQLLSHRLADSLFVLDHNRGIGTRCRNGQPLFLQKGHVFLHAPSGLIQTILDGMANSRKALEIGRVKSKKGGVLRRFDDERVFEIDHREVSGYLIPAAFKMA